MSFVKVILDQGSLNFFTKHFSDISEPLSRQLILRAVWDMTTDKLCPADYLIDLVAKIFEVEKDATIYNTAYDLINKFMEKYSTSEDDDKIRRILFDFFFHKSITESLSTTSIECMAKFASTKEHFEKIYEFFQDQPTAFNIGQVYTLIEILLALNYGEQFDRTSYNKLIEYVKAEDQTDTLGKKLLQFEVMELPPDKRPEELERYMLNKDQKISANQLDSFSAGFNSKYLPIEVRRAYYDKFFELLVESTKHNTNMYSAVNEI